MSFKFCVDDSDFLVVSLCVVGMTDHLSVLERLVALVQVPGSRWSFWHDRNSQLGRMDAEIEILAIPRNNVVFYTTWSYL